MGVEIKFSKSYVALNSWVMANIIQLGTQSFCDRFVNHAIDPGRRLYDQMVMAARCGVANIAEGSARYSTSIESEMRLIDVARASFDEVHGDYFNFLLRRRVDAWRMELDRPNYSNSLMHDAAIHILTQKAKYDPWIESADPNIAANALLVLCERIDGMLEGQLRSILERFKLQGGFSENMTTERIEARKQQAFAENAPLCPKCGKPMLKRTQTRRQNQGREFWGCSDYPRCNGTWSM